MTKSTHQRARGEAQGSAVLTEAKVREIRNQYAAGNVTCHELSLIYGVSATQIHRIATGKTWRHIPFDIPVARRAPGRRKIIAPKISKQRGKAVLPPMTDEGRERLKIRFWSKVDKTESCWLWTAARAKRGYGKFSISQYGKTILRDAHRVAFELANHPIPDGDCVCHACDTPECVNPDHLFLGSQRDNIRDMMQKRRGTIGDKSTARRFPEKLPRGADNVSTVLNPDIVREIRHLRTNGASTNSLARRFGVSDGAIQDVIKRKTWQHVD